AARHAPAGAVGAGGKAQRVALAADDVGLGPHRTWNDAELAGRRAHRTLARHAHGGREMPFALEVVVMAVDGPLLASERRQLGAHGAEHGGHHQLAVVARELLRQATAAT